MTCDPALLAAAAPLVLGALTVLKITKVLIMVLFVISAVLLIAVVLLQEGKGGGIAGAFGGAAAETFGVKAGTVNRFTSILATVFIGLALLHAGLSSAMGDSVVKPEETPKPDTAPAPDETHGAPPSPAAPAVPVPPPANGMGDTPMDAGMGAGGAIPPPGPTPPAPPQKPPEPPATPPAPQPK